MFDNDFIINIGKLIIINILLITVIFLGIIAISY